MKVRVTTQRRLWVLGISFSIFTVSIYFLVKYLLTYDEAVSKNPEQFYDPTEDLLQKVGKARWRNRWNSNCTFTSCFSSDRCRNGLTVYLYPLINATKLGLNLPDYSKEFLLFRKAITASSFYEKDPNKACLFVPNVDLFNIDRVSSLDDVNTAINSLKW